LLLIDKRGGRMAVLRIADEGKYRVVRVSQAKVVILDYGEALEGSSWNGSGSDCLCRELKPSI
jgi:hypothetical protein